MTHDRETIQRKLTESDAAKKAQKIREGKDPNEPNTYTPGEVAEMFGVSVQMVKYWRRTKKIFGAKVGDSTMYTYTPEQILAARTEPETPGPKPRSQQKNTDKEGFNPSVTLPVCSPARLLRQTGYVTIGV